MTRSMRLMPCREKNAAARRRKAAQLAPFSSDSSSAYAKSRSIVDRYVQYWIDRLGVDARSRVLTNSKDHDRVWAWYVGREAELAELSLRAGR